jgi:hypothetical protein
MTTEPVELRVDIVLELRRMFVQGRSTAELILFIRDRLQLGKDQRVTVFWYLGNTFKVPLPTLLAIGSWHGFAEGFQTDEAVEAIVRPAIEAAESEWMRDQA